MTLQSLASPNTEGKKKENKEAAEKEKAWKAGVIWLTTSKITSYRIVCVLQEKKKKSLINI